MDLISVYTRRQAIEDGVLYDVSNVAKEAGIVISTAITSAVWGLIVPDSSDEKQYAQSTSGRLWDTLYVLYHAIRANRNKNTVRFVVAYLQGGKLKTHILKAVVHGGDNFEPVMTIMLPDED